MQRHIAQTLNRLGQAGPLVVGELAGAQMALVDTADRADHTHRQLRRAHLHGEHGYGQALVQGNMFCDIDGQRRFSHGRARGKHHQVTGLKACRQTIQVVETGRHARHIIGVIRHLLDAVQ